MRIDDAIFFISFSISEVRFICLDVANGYSQFFVDYVKKVREAYPDHTIMVRFGISVIHKLFSKGQCKIIICLKINGKKRGFNVQTLTE